MFQTLTSKIESVFSSLRDKGVLTEENMTDALKQIRAALLEADVNFKVVKQFIAKIKEEAAGQNIHASLTPGQQLIKIVHEQVEELLGRRGVPLTIAPISPTVIMMVGLQGSGKTTSAGKLAKLLTSEGKSVLLVAADIYRPAAVDQLKVLAERTKSDFFSLPGEKNAAKIAREGLAYAREKGVQIAIFDTAGRLHIDESMMEELKEIKKALTPHETLFVADAMTGQDAVRSAKQFNSAVELTGVILTKLDGDARGGAALSIREVTGKPIKFIGVGEKLDRLEKFHPERMASRILGMGDMMSLIEKAQKSYDADAGAKLKKKLKKKEIDLNDFLDQLKQIKKMGGLGEVAGMLPGMGKLKGVDQVDDKELVKIEAIIQSMTAKERANHALLNGSRRKRIARGSGTTVQDVNRLIKQFMQMQKMVKMMMKPGKGMGGLMNMLGMGGGGAPHFR